jgi:hypothetical protein
MYPGMIRRLSTLAILFVTLTLSGCSHGPKTTLKNVPENLPADYTLLQKPEQGISIGAPPGWALLGAKKDKKADDPGTQPGTQPGGQGDFQAELDKMADKMDEESAAKIQKRVEDMAAKGIYIYVTNSGIRPIVGEEETHFLVKKESVGGNAQLQDVADEIAKDVNGMKPETIDLPIGKAVRVSGKVTRVDGGEVKTVTYGLVNGSDKYIVRFVTEEAGINMEEIAAGVMPTLRITK